MNAPVASEAIVVTDIVGSAQIISRYGERVARRMKQDLWEFIKQIGEQHGMQCLKDIGDGYMTTYGAGDSAIGAVKAVEASFELLDRLADRNSDLPPDLAIPIRGAIHFGQVDVFEEDRQGFNVSFTYRLEGITPPSPIRAFKGLDPMTEEERDFQPMTREKFPERDYLLCSEAVAEILKLYGDHSAIESSIQFVGLFKFKGFYGWQEVYLLSRQSNPE